MHEALPVPQVGVAGDAALEAGMELETQNAFALRSLGGLLVIAGPLAAGAERFLQALEVIPDWLIAKFNLAKALLRLDPEEQRDEANRLLLQVIEAKLPYGELGNGAKELRGSIASEPGSACRSAGRPAAACG